MRRRKTTYLSFVAGAVILAIGLAGQTRADVPAYELFIEQSPTTAGRVTPNSGRHKVSANAVVALAAEPRPGYEFACWLGDVSDPAARQTTVLVNSPKVVVAVFTPESKRHLPPIAGAGGGGLGETLPAGTDLSMPGWSPAGGRKPAARTIVVPTVPTPEPTTALLLALGALALRRRA